MRLLDSLSIRTRLFVMTGVGAAFGLLLLLTALFSLNAFRADLQRVSTEVENSTRALTLISGMQNSFQIQLRGLNNMLLRNFMQGEFEKAQTEFHAGRSRFWQQVDELEALDQLSGIKGSPRLDRIRQQAGELNKLYDEVLAENEPGMPKYTVMVDAALRDADLPLNAALASAYEAIGEASSLAAARTSQVADQRFEENAALILLVGVLGALLSLALAARIGTRILGRLGGELEPVVAAARRVADGDLSSGLNTGKAAADSLVAAVDAMQLRLRQLIAGVKAGAENTAANAGALHRSANEVAEATATQSDSAAEITAAIEELTTAIAVMAESAGAAADASRYTREMAGKSGQIIHQAISEIGHISEQANASAQSMLDLKQHTLEIAGFAREIKEISEQTNLLSLNAAIEAARAGDAGRGFAVVADEVRKLANHTSETTRKIERLVTRLGDAAEQTTEAVAATALQAGRGTDLATAAEAAIATIEDYCERSMVAASEIVDVLAEQRLAAEQISRNTERMAQMVERGAKAASDSSTTAREVASLAATLREATLQFSV